MTKRVLVTTSLECTWPKDQPVLFLGEWCKRYSRKHVWESLDYKTMPCHWDDRREVHKAHEMLIELVEELIVELSSKLNEIHGANYSTRYWKILVGPWLHRFTRILYDRWSSIKQVTESGEVGSCYVCKKQQLDWIPNDMADFTAMAIDDDWNEALYHQLLSKYFSTKLELIINQNSRVNKTKQMSKTPFLRGVILFIINTYNRIFVRKNNHFLISTYLPIQSEIILQLRLKQIPKLWTGIRPDRMNADLSQRKWSIGREPNKKCFSTTVRQMIPLHIPTAYLEGFNNLVTKSYRQPWPKHPRSIFTSNSFSGDDVFKLWAASGVEIGSRFVIGQHGGFYGTSSLSVDETHILSIADVFLTWGWGSCKSNKIKTVGKLKWLVSNCQPCNNGPVLLVQLSEPRYRYHLASHRTSDYIDDQFTFVQSLPEKIQQEVKVRLYSVDYGWDQKFRWQAELPKISLSGDELSIKKMLSRSRICICTYNATTFLETMSWNYPTLMFWNPEHWEMRNEAQPYFDILESAGIFHTTPESAAKKLTEIWNNIDDWWQSEKVQESREIFCDRFAATPPDMMDKLESILRFSVQDKN